MLNQDAIFVNGFSRGGTTILTNLLASHPDVCLVGETHHVFKGHRITDSPWRVLSKCLRHDVPILVGHGQDFFSPRLIKPRKQLSLWAKKRIDRILYREKLRSQHPLLNLYKSPDVVYTQDELVQARLLCKNIDGMIYANDTFVEMYPDAAFFGLVRNGLAVCEGHLRRGRPAAETGWRYQLLVDKMLRDAKELPRYQIMRFEDLICNPVQTLQSLYSHVGLDLEKLRQLRMQVRRVMDAQGNHRLNGASEWNVVWLEPSELPSYFQQDVDQNQIKRLSQADRDAFLKQAGSAMERLGYDVTGQGGETSDMLSLWTRADRRSSGPQVPGRARAA